MLVLDRFALQCSEGFCIAYYQEAAETPSSRTETTYVKKSRIFKIFQICYELLGPSD